MNELSHFALHDLKRVYTVLHANLLNHLELLDSDFFSELQTYLQKQARLDAVDTSHHAQWDRWLGQQASSALPVAPASLN